MLTSLCVFTPQLDTKFERFAARFRRNKTELYYRQVGALKIKCIDYTKYIKDINWQKLDKIIGAQRNRLLCQKDLVLPNNLGYKRFDDSEYKLRLCKNLGISLVSKASKKVRVGIVDDDAIHTAFVKYILKYTDDVVVVTKNDQVYKVVADNLLEELGAPITISRSYHSLENCELIIALSPIKQTICTDNKALILSEVKPSFSVDCVLIYDYVIDLPKQFVPLCPENIDKTYFAAALYSVYNVYQLGSVVPKACISENGVHTASSLQTLLININTKT